MTPPAKDPWVVIDYETDMLFAMCRLLQIGNHRGPVSQKDLNNAIVESALLHLRQLIDVLLSRGRKDDDINLKNVLPGFPRTHSEKLNNLEQQYGESNEEDTYHWIVNKNMAHATLHRSESHDYEKLLEQLVPLVADILREMNNARHSSQS